MATDDDPLGYYAVLGLSPSASANDIKSAFRRLAKQYHPDLNQSDNAKGKFQSINQAHAVLGDPETRRTYDASRYSDPEPRAKKREIQPICCSRCGKVTAQPRATVMYRVVSFLLSSTRTPIQGTFCAACARMVALKASAISAVFGWWGFPLGPFWTIGAIFRNAMGGRHSSEVDDKLAWYNALAFYSKGDFALAYALAQRARRAADEEISIGAMKLMEHLRSRGLAANSPALKNPWVFSMPAFGIHLLLLLAVPVALTVAIQASASNASTPKSAYQATPARPLQREATAQPLSPVKPPVATCKSTSRNGDILAQSVSLSEKGHSIRIDNGSGGNAIVKVRDALTDRVAVSWYVTKGSTATVSNLPDGDYKIQFMTGGELNESCKSFLEGFSASEFPGMKSLVTRYTDTQIIRSQLSFTLYSVANGNVRPSRIDRGAFEAD